MKQFYFKVTFDVYQDSFKDGQLDHVNYFNQNELIKANNLNDAINELFKNKLFFDYDKNLVFYDQDKNILNYSLLVDKDNCEVTKEYQIFKDWQQNKAILFSCNLEIEIFELQEINLKDFF